MGIRVAVVGLGAVGAATALHLSRRSATVVGFDQYTPPHSFGSSHGETRITRLSIGEGDAYIPLVKRSHQLWRELEHDTSQEILTVTGGLILGPTTAGTHHGVPGFVASTISYAQQYGIHHRTYTPGELSNDFPEFILSGNEQVYFEHEAGFVRPELAISAQLHLASKNRATLYFNTPVLTIERLPGGGVSVTTTQGSMSFDRCILTTGGWIRRFVPPPISSQLRITRQVLHWLRIEGGRYSLDRFPIFIWCYGSSDEDMIYGFPSLDGRTMKVASESVVESTTPDSIDRSVSKDEQRTFFERKISPRLRYLAAEVERSVVCQYTVAPRGQFIVDTHPEIPECLFASCCSGHGFKHSAAVGEALAESAFETELSSALRPFQLRASKEYSQGDQ